MDNVPPPKSPPFLPKIEIRIVSKDLVLIRPRLSAMWYVTRERPQQSPPWLKPQRDFVDEIGVAIPTLVWGRRIEELWKYLFIPAAGRRRLYLDFIDLSICQLCIRMLHKQVQHHHLDAPRSDHVVAAKNFLKKLETCRKRARNAAQHSIGREKYQWIRSEWQKLARRLRQYLNCRCGNVKLPGSNRRRVILINEVVRLAEKELREQNLSIPAPSVLRRWARLLIRSVKRGREGALRTVDLVQTPAGMSCLRFFMRARAFKLMDSGDSK